MGVWVAIVNICFIWSVPLRDRSSDNFTVSNRYVHLQVNWAEIESIASKPEENHVFGIASFDDLGEALVDRLVDFTCVINTQPSPGGEYAHMRRTRIGSNTNRLPECNELVELVKLCFTLFFPKFIMPIKITPISSHLAAVLDHFWKPSI